MPKMVRMEVNPDYTPGNPEDAATFKALQKAGAPKNPLPYVTGLENIRNSRGMLRLKTEGQRTGVKIETNLEDMSIEQLKVMMLAAGATPTKKAMTRDEVIQTIRTKLAALEVVDEDAGTD